MDRFDPFVKYADVYGDIINWEKDPMNKPQNQNKYFFSDGKTYYEQICKMLRLMSVFKEAFNQIYSNEDEISEAWENFVNNLSASVVEGSEPDVTLTWTDDSVNFEFTMVPGVPGEQGVGITSISFNSDYTMTITLSDGNTYTSMSLKGETGPQGPQGETGSGLQILDVYATLADLQSAHPTGQPGDAYQVGSAGNYTLYIWSSSQSAWIPAGSLATVSPSVSNPLMDGTASAGSSDLYSRGDHVHPSDTSRASKEELDALIKTSQALIDQSFTYRESPAIQDGVAKIDSIKGNTLIWNQLVENGNFETSDGWTALSDATFTVSNNTCTATLPNDSSNVRRNARCINGHVYIMTATVKTEGSVFIAIAGIGPIYFANNSDFETKSSIFTWGATTGPWALYIRNSTAEPAVAEIKNIQLFDITLMGLSNLNMNQFRSLFNNDYYAYNTGRLLSLNPAGIRTTSQDNVKQNELTIPAATYFSTGMKSAGTAYDELTPTKATTRLKSVTLDGSFNWVLSGTNGYVITANNSGITDCKQASSALTNCISNLFPRSTTTWTDGYFGIDNRAIWVGDANLQRFRSLDAFKTYLNNNPLTIYYELETPAETAVDLDMDFMAYEDGTEQLLPVNGSVPSTSPIIADITYLSIDDAMEYVLEKLANVPQNTQQILESLEDDVSDLQTDVGALQPAVSSLQTSVGNINTNIGQLSSTVAGHTSSISDMQSDITDLNTGLNNLNTGLNDLEDTVTDNTSRIGTLETGLTNTNNDVDAIDARVLNLETDLLKIVKKEYDYDSVAGNTNFGVQTGLSQETGYKIIGIVGSEVQQGEYTSAEPWIIVTQAHVHYTSTGGLVLSMMARNVSEYTKTNVRVYLYLLCIKDSQSE